MCLALALSVAAVAAGASGRVHWDYSDRYGPAHWGDLSSRFAMCADGMQQSPIDLTAPIETVIQPVRLNWAAADWQADNTGATLLIQAPDAGHAVVEGDRFALVQFHFHSPSEHTIDGRRYPMEAQFVHVAEDNRIAVVSVMLRGGGRHPTFEAIIAAAPAEPGTRAAVGPLDLMSLITDPGDVLRYQGSLTAPPCTENVTWTVLTDPLVVSDAAIDAFRLLFGDNARPLQPLNRRYVLTD